MALPLGIFTMPEYAHLLTGDYRRRIITMLVFTFSNLDNEVRFFDEAVGRSTMAMILDIDRPVLIFDCSRIQIEIDPAVKRRPKRNTW